MCQGNRDLCTTTIRSEFCQQPERAWKPICTPDPPDENSAWLTPRFQACDTEQGISHILQESDLQNCDLIN